MLQIIMEGSKQIVFAVENVGQTPDEMEFFLRTIQSKLIEVLKEKKGIDASVAEEMATLFIQNNLGITLDINHALHLVKEEIKKKILAQLAKLTGKSEEEVLRWLSQKDTDRDKTANIMRQMIKEKCRLTLEEWFNKFGDKIRCFHIFTPTIRNEREDEKGFRDELTVIIDLYNKYNLRSPVYLETKKNSKTTQGAFYLAKRLINN